MKEELFLKIINKTLSDPSFLGDDCALLTQNLLGNNGIYITQDSLIEDVHFSRESISAYQLGCKSLHVNFSDLAAMCAKPLFVTISLSLPPDIKKSFVEDFYIGVNDVCLKTGAKVAGGDITGSDKIYISVTAIGQKTAKCNISRSNAKAGDVILISDCHGNSAGGLKLIQAGKKKPTSLIKAHIEPKAELEKSEILAELCNRDFAMMDSSDGLCDALYKIAKASNVQMEIDFSKIPVSHELIEEFPNEYKDFVFWGGEDYKLVCCVDKSLEKELVKKGFWQIGQVKDVEKEPIVIINNGENFVINENVLLQKSFNHFKK